MSFEPSIFDEIEVDEIRETTLEMIRSESFKRCYDLNKITEDEFEDITNNISEYWDIPLDDDWLEVKDLIRDTIRDEISREIK